MRIESFHVQGFKSLADVKVDGLSEINVFYGLNDVGKSNIFEALALWRQVVAMPRQILLKHLEAIFGSPFIRLRDGNTIHLRVVSTLEQRDVSELGVSVEGVEADIVENFSVVDKMQIVGEIEMEMMVFGSETVFQCLIKSWTQARGKMLFQISQSSLNNLLSRLMSFHIIKASRHFQIEQKKKGNDLGPISHYNLKQALFYAYLSRNPQQKHRLEAIRRILTEPPFSLGELDIALDPATDQIDIGFARPEGRLPLENLGAGSQQLLLMLGQIFLNDYPIIAIEEPEMNLSPQYQQWLLVALRELMQDPDVKLNQLFISTHSPYFEFEENFFDVTMDEQGCTHVTRSPIKERNRYFPDTKIGQETGARLNSLNQIRLYDGLIQDLELQRGDLVIFTKNEAGRWEIRPEREIIEELETVSDNN